ncbi:U-box domain-containing protein 52 [Ziziphus jujuba]|uniref:RING-type E3 ubiquitin transferase n=2 Tax=Ziziphus jujuba TaxID=326968 RepID=A0A6P4AJU0_ZIZJJ|nr:U-box domain-containing protein 52 [Ziziphus jujuba]KAH7524248.1 hypothetical protein FEM48_Zijuj06G0099200 [Ziziphus jujuba var. spinosa]
MWLQKYQVEKQGGANGLVAVAIDKDKNSQNALKWTIDNLLQRNQTVILIHVKLKTPSYSSMTSISSSYSKFSQMYDGMHEENALECRDVDPHTRELFLPFRCFCTRKDIKCKDIVLEDIDAAKALIEYTTVNGIENLILGASSKTGFLRFKATDVPGTVMKGAPDFCNVYVVSKGKVQSTRSASRPAPAVSPLRYQFQSHPAQANMNPEHYEQHYHSSSARGYDRPPERPTKTYDEIDTIRSPFTRKGPNAKSYGELSLAESDISFVSSGRPSVDRGGYSPYYENLDSGRTTPRISNSTEIDINHSFESMLYGRRSVDITTPPEYASCSHDSDRLSTSSQSIEEVEAEMRRLKLELKQTMEMYSTACKEALTAKQKAVELQLWKIEEEKRFEEARLAEEAALAIVEKERARSRAAMEAAEASKRIADLEAQKRKNAEMKALKEAEERQKVMASLAKSDVRYRKYSIEEIEIATEHFAQSRRIGEGGYGPVYKCNLDHTQVAIKVLRPDAAHGRSQFQQEVEVLCNIRHPNMVLLLGACPEYGCLVYEFMANGSLEDRLFCRGNTKPLSWQHRFRIAAEIGTGLLFLHQTKPEPLVHRDLKPGNILLDRNLVSKISDVGLARLVPPTVADTVTQYRMTSTAGTFCYIDPEYQQTGMLGVKSDVYSLGIMFLQIITAKPPMGLTHHVGRAIEKGCFEQMLDPAVKDWPIQETLSFAKLALKCAELRRKDRPDLGKVVLPELDRLRALAEDTMHLGFMDGNFISTTNQSQVSVQLEDEPYSRSAASSRNQSTASSRNPSVAF